MCLAWVSPRAHGKAGNSLSIQFVVLAFFGQFLTCCFMGYHFDVLQNVKSLETKEIKCA